MNNVYRVEYEERTENGSLHIVYRHVVATSGKDAVEKLLEHGLITMDTYVVSCHIIFPDVEV